MKDFEESKWRVARGSLQDLVLEVEFVMTLWDQYALNISVFSFVVFLVL